MEFTDDDRRMELESIEAIFPNSTEIDYGTLTGLMQIPIQCDSKIDVRLISPSSTAVKPDVIKDARVKYIPSMKFSFRLNNQYPFKKNLDFDVASDVLPIRTLQSIKNHLDGIWEEFKDQILYYMIDYLTQECQEEVIDELKKELYSCTDQTIFEKIISYNKKKEKEEFEMQTFDCEICMNNKKGLVSTKIRECGHTFCNKCLYEFFTSSIISGDIDKVHCPNFQCTKQISISRKDEFSLENLMSNPIEYKKRVFTLLIPMDTMVHIFESECKDKAEIESLLKRYQKLYIKNQFNKIKANFPNKVVSCPRTGCEEQIFRDNVDDELVVCPRCKYAFCVSCFKSWHGKYYRCKIDENDAYSNIPIDALERYLDAPEGSRERTTLGYEYGSQLIKKMANVYILDKLFKEMIDTKGDLTKCPHCGVVTQRLDGCNKMSCPFCQTFFCNLCGDELSRNDPYYHFRVPGETCYGKLFEGMEGIEDPAIQIINDGLAQVNGFEGDPGINVQ